jgi:hypothetical protein
MVRLLAFMQKPRVPEEGMRTHRVRTIFTSPGQCRVGLQLVRDATGGHYPLRGCPDFGAHARLPEKPRWEATIRGITLRACILFLFALVGERRPELTYKRWIAFILVPPPWRG